jgi:hypothetical protein
MNTQRAAEVQAVLEGVALPATRDELVAYARAQTPDVSRELETLPDRAFERLDEVGELLTLARSAPKGVEGDVPRPESGEPPGGSDYLTAHASDTGVVRHDAPRDNPPQKAIEQASQLQKKQKAAQGS